MTDACTDVAASLVMDVPSNPSIIAAERLNEGVVLKFDNGKCGFYSSSLLFSLWSECEELNEADVEW